MEVRIIKATENPVDVIAFAAGICYGKRDTNPRRVRACFKAGHLSVFEHASVTFIAEGISRACLAQLTRHRLASFCVESQRYNRYDLAGEYWYVIPEGAADKLTWFRKCMRDAASAYQQALNMGIKPEDARYLLPEATKTNAVVTMNCRELFHFLDMRTDGAAQWEIRDMAWRLFAKLGDHSKQWGDLMQMWDGAL